ncbi:MAG: hypothetical protein OK439_05590 [Thaumarchaeota archaeon]|nr:hypothetical protein [Nitrososphaerota archaeon]
MSQNQQKEPELQKTATTQKSASLIRAVRNIAISVLGLLLLQYILGTATNLFANFPTQTASINPLDNVFTNGPTLVLVHFVNGLALGLLSISAVVVSVIVKSKRLILITVCGFGTILFAGESGIEFVLGWYVNNLFSFLMSLGFILSFTAYFVLLWFANPRQLSIPSK